MTVFIPQASTNRDFTDARRYGTLKFVTRRSSEVYPDTDSGELRRVEEEVRSNLSDFDAEKDHLMLSGDPVLIAVCVAAIVDRQFSLGIPLPGIRFLKYDRQERQYYQVHSEI